MSAGMASPAQQASRPWRKRPTRASLSFSLVRAHRSSYWIMCLAVFATTTLSCATLQARQAGLAYDGLHGLEGLNAYHRILTKAYYDLALNTVSLIALVFCLLVTVFLVLSSVSFLVQERRREYGLMRLNGASGKQVVAMALREFSLPLALADAAGCLAGSLLTVPVGMAFIRAMGTTDIDLLFHPRARLWVAAVAFALMMAVCLLGVWLATRRFGAETPLKLMTQPAVKDKKASRLRIVCSLALFLASITVAFMPVDRSEFYDRLLGLIVLLIITVYVAAPLLVPPVASLLGLLAEKTAAGPGLLARQRVRRGREGATAIALPAMMALTILVSFILIMQAGRMSSVVLSIEPMKADVVASSDDLSQAGRISRTLQGLGREVGTADIYQTQQWVLTDKHGNIQMDTFLQVTWAQARDLADPSHKDTAPKVLQGSLADLGAGKVAISRAYDNQRKPGDTITLIDRHDKRHQVQVVAVIEPPKTTPHVNMDMLTTEDGLPREGENGRLYAFITARDHTQADDIAQQIRDTTHKITALNRQDFIDDYIKTSIKEQQGTPLMIAGGTILSLIFLVQSIAIGISERRMQNRRLNQMGVTRGALAWSAAIETTLDVTAGIILSLVAVAITEASVAISFVRDGVGIQHTPIIADIFLPMSLLLLAVAIATTILCTRLTHKNQPTKH